MNSELTNILKQNKHDGFENDSLNFFYFKYIILYLLHLFDFFACLPRFGDFKTTMSLLRRLHDILVNLLYRVQWICFSHSAPYVNVVLLY